MAQLVQESVDFDTAILSELKKFKQDLGFAKSF